MALYYDAQSKSFKEYNRSTPVASTSSGVMTIGDIANSSAFGQSTPKYSSTEQYQSVGDSGGQVLGVQSSAPQSAPQPAPQSQPVAQLQPSVSGVPAGSGSTLSSAITLAEQQAEDARRREEEALALEKETLSNEYTGLRELIEQKQQFAKDQAQQGVTDVQNERDLALQSLERLRGESEQNKGINTQQATELRNEARSIASGGFADTLRRIRGYLSGLGGFASDSSGAVGLVGQAQRDLNSQMSQVQRDYNTSIRDINNNYSREVNVLNEKEDFVRNEALSRISDLRLQENQNIEELNLALIQGDREKITSLKTAIAQSRDRIAAIDNDLANYKQQVASQKASISASAAAAAERARISAEENTNVLSTLQQLFGGTTSTQAGQSILSQLEGTTPIASTANGFLVSGPEGVTEVVATPEEQQILINLGYLP